MKASLSLGKGAATKSDELLEKFQTAFDPLPHFLENYIAFFYNGYGCIYARRYKGQIVLNACTCLLQSVSCFDFFNTIVEKTYPEP